MPTEPNTGLPVVLAGACLALVGVLRLTRRGLRAMPAPLAWGAVVAGGAVAALGAALWTSPPRRLELVPIPSATPASPALPGASPALPAGSPALPGASPAPAGSPASPPGASPGPASASPAPPAPPRGVIAGRVRLPSGSPVPGLPVVLRHFAGTTELEARRTTTGADGTFLFDGLQAGGADAYAVATDFAGATFSSDIVVLSPEPHGSLASVDLTVAPPTTDPSALEVDVDSLAVVGGGRGVQVVQVMALRNRGDRAWAGRLRLPLLPGATGITPQQGLVRPLLEAEDDALVSSAPLLPGRTEIVLLYAVPMPRGGLHIERRAELPTRRFALLVGRGLEAEGKGLRGGRTVRLGPRGERQPYRQWVRTDLAPGERLTAVVRPAPGVGRWAGAIVGAGLAAAVAVVVYPLLRRRGGAP